MSAEKWYNAGLCFECTRCGNCCSGDPGYVWVRKEEIRRISEFLGRTDGWLDGKHLRRVGLRYSLTEKPGGDCIFLNRKADGTGCLIHAVRPLQCRTWPFWNQNLRSAVAWNTANKKCPGMNRGKHHDLSRVEALRTQRS
jgi:Fe-S-cluster containining protein